MINAGARVIATEWGKGAQSENVLQVKNAVSVMFLARASKQSTESNMTTEVLQSVAGIAMRTAWVYLD